MLNLTLTERSKVQLSPGLVASYDIQPGNRDTSTLGHTHTHLLTYLGPTRGGRLTKPYIRA